MFCIRSIHPALERRSLLRKISVFEAQERELLAILTEASEAFRAKMKERFIRLIENTDHLRALLARKTLKLVVKLLPKQAQPRATSHSTPRAAARGIRSTTRRAGNKSVASSSGDPDSEGEPPHAALSHPCCTALTRLRSFACLVFAAHPQHLTLNRRTPSQPAAQSAAGLLSFPQFTQGSFSL